MGSLTFYFGTMNCGKSTLALQMHHNARAAGKAVRLFSKLDRGGAMISSRIGLSEPATTVDDDLDLASHVIGLLGSGEAVDELIVDEAQFLHPVQVDQLASLADERDVEVRCFGLLSDFQTRLFPGSQRLLELADHREELQLVARCWCGSQGTHNARTVDGEIVRDGAQVVVGDVGGARCAYEVLCRHHHRDGVTRAAADRDPGHDGAVDSGRAGGDHRLISSASPRAHECGERMDPKPSMASGPGLVSGHTVARCPGTPPC